MKYCQKCNTQLQDTMKYCPFCGTPTEEQPLLRCRRCGEPIEAGDNFCGICGESCYTLESFEQEPLQESGEQTQANRGFGGRIGGSLMMVTGCGLVCYGVVLNNSWEAQVNSFFSSGTTNPGTVWVTLGIFMSLMGLVFLVTSFQKK